MKTALILGASRGIGAAIAKEFAKNNYFVCINYNKSLNEAKSLLETISKDNGQGEIFKADISNFNEVNDMISTIISKYKKIDVLIVSAGISKPNLLIDSSIDDIYSIINTNLLGTIYSCKAVLPYMLSNHFGKIITISSMWGEVGASCESVYSASKGGVIAFTKALAKEVGYNGINVNCISPGLINTQMNKNLSTEDIKELVDSTPSSRIGEPIDIAKAALFLASEDSSFINGQVISVNGGFVI